MKRLSNLLTTIIAIVANTGLRSYCGTSYSRGFVNQMWDLKNYIKDLFEYMQARSCNNIKTINFSTLCTTIPQSKLNYNTKELVLLVNTCILLNLKKGVANNESTYITMDPVISRNIRPNSVSPLLLVALKTNYAHHGFLCGSIVRSLLLCFCV
jgi:hypothetical protein